MTQQPTITHKQLNNKTRKGDYLYIKAPGQRGKYYKYREDTTSTPYVAYYLDSVDPRRSKKGRLDDYLRSYTQGPTPKQTTQLKRQAINYRKRLQKIRQAPRLDQHIVRGINHVIIRNIEGTTKFAIKKAYEKLLEPLVKDREVREIIGTEHNMQKLKHRFQHTVQLLDMDGKLKGTITSTAEFTTGQIIEQLNRKLPPGTKITDKYDLMRKNIQQISPNITYRHTTNGTLRHTNVTTTFRRA